VSDLRQALEEALLDNPEDRASHAAYADFLSEQDDPHLAARGEFISVQLALEDSGLSLEERDRLRQRERELLINHQLDWLGSLDAALAEDHIHFARGWIDSLRIGNLDETNAGALVDSPEIRLLRELMIEGDGYLRNQEGRPLWDEALRRHRHAGDVLAQSPFLGNVRILRLGEQVEDDSEDCPFFDAHMESPAAPDLAAGMPRLEELYLLAKRFSSTQLFSLPTLGNLRILQVYHLEDRHPLHVLADNPVLGNLTHLLLHPHGYADPSDPFIDLAGVRALVRSPHLRSLAHLQIRLCNMGDRGCQEIVDSGILQRLKVLDLRHGCITDAGARVLAACPDLRNLQRLDINRNGLTGTGIAALEATGIQVRARNQQTPEELAHSQYLEEGDFE
jgi:uncharacterized protein (TIGR02996 family)